MQLKLKDDVRFGIKYLEHNDQLTHLYNMLFKPKNHVMYHLDNTNRVVGARASKLGTFYPKNNDHSTTKFCHHGWNFCVHNERKLLVHPTKSAPRP